MKPGRCFTSFVFLLLFAIVAGMVCRAYYSFVFLPDFHGGWTNTWSRLVDFEGWWAFVSSPVGMILNLAWLAPLTMAFLLLGWPGKSRRRQTSR